MVAAFALIAGALFVFRPAPTPGPFLRDFEAYWSAGRARSAGDNPYGVEIWRFERAVPGVNAARSEVLPFVGPPASLPLWSALARFAYDVGASLWYGVLFASGLTLAAVCLAGSGARASPQAFLAAAAAAVAFGPLTSALALGQIAMLAFCGAAIVAWSTASRMRRQTLVSSGGTFFALLQPNVALGLISQLDRRRTVAGVAIGAFAAYVAGALVAEWNWPLRYARLLFEHHAVESTSAIQLTPAAIAHGAGASTPAASAVAIVTALCAIAAAIAVSRKIPEAFARFAAFSALTPFVSMFFHEHDLVVAYAAAIFCAIRTRGLARAIALAGTLLVAVDWLGLAQRPTGIAQSALLALAAACAFSALGSRAGDSRDAVNTQRPAVRLTVAAFGVVTALFVAAAWGALLHPVPVWPDALGNFHAGPNATIAQTWFAEQQRTGLLSVNPFWAFLRTLSLLGCALLALAIYRTDAKAGV